MDGRNVVYKYRCLSREGIIIIDPVNLGKRAFWQCFRHVDDIFPELLIFIDSQTFYLDNGKRKYVSSFLNNYVKNNYIFVKIFPANGKAASTSFSLQHGVFLCFSLCFFYMCFMQFIIYE